MVKKTNQGGASEVILMKSGYSADREAKRQPQARRQPPLACFSYEQAPAHDRTALRVGPFLIQLGAEVCEELSLHVLLPAMEDNPGHMLLGKIRHLPHLPQFVEDGWIVRACCQVSWCERGTDFCQAWSVGTLVARGCWWDRRLSELIAPDVSLMADHKVRHFVVVCSKLLSSADVELVALQLIWTVLGNDGTTRLGGISPWDPLNFDIVSHVRSQQRRKLINDEALAIRAICLIEHLHVHHLALCAHKQNKRRQNLWKHGGSQ